MPTIRQYTFDIDTKRYLNRVNTYRSLSGLPSITNGDAVDIDNFVIGLKDLGLWNAMVCWLLRSQHNIGTGSTVLSLGSLGISNCDGIMANSPTWGLSGVTFGGTVANSARINLPVDIRFQISYSGSIFGCLNYQAGVIEDNNFGIFLSQDFNGDPAYPCLSINHQSAQGVTPFVTRNGTRYFQSTRGGVFLTGFSTVAGNFETNAQSNYRNGTLIARESSLGTINPDTRPIDLPYDCFIGRGNYVTGGVTCSISLVAAKVLTNSEMTSLHNLYKATIGKGLGLP